MNILKLQIITSNQRRYGNVKSIVRNAAHGRSSRLMHRLPFPVGRIRAKEEGLLTHSDVIGLMKKASLKGARHYVFSRTTAVAGGLLTFLRIIQKKQITSDHSLQD